MIEFSQVSLQRGIKPLLQNANLRIHDGQKLALIGPNGAGKSSIFALLTGVLGVDQGTLSVPRQWRIAHMKQEVEASQRPAIDYVIDGDQEYRAIEQAMANAQSDKDLADAIDRMDQHNGYQVPVLAEQLLHGLGFQQTDLLRSVSDFSGGWRIRLNLAQALLKPSDLLLLDEPTNHLDLEATLWLEQWLGKYQGTLLFISHDRDFIDGVANNIVHLHQQQLALYPGNYSAYERIRTEKLAQQQTLFEKQQTRVKEIEAFVTRFKAKASKAKQAQSRLKELQRMELIAPAHVDSPFSFEFPCHNKMSAPLMALDQADLGYPGKTLLSSLSTSIVAGHRIGLLGPNGAGKTTSFYMIVGLIKPNSGNIILDKQNITKFPMYKRAQHGIGYLAQEASVFRKLSIEDNILSVLELTKLSKKERLMKMESLIEEFGLGHIRKSRGDLLSGGERRRTEIARALATDPNFILLDEPFAGVDPVAVEDIQRIVAQLKDKNIGILITDHNVQETLAITDRTYLMFEGSILKHGIPEELAEDEMVRKVYLGQNFELRKKKIFN